MLNKVPFKFCPVLTVVGIAAATTTTKIIKIFIRLFSYYRDNQVNQGELRVRLLQLFQICNHLNLKLRNQKEIYLEMLKVRQANLQIKTQDNDIQLDHRGILYKNLLILKSKIVKVVEPNDP